jgi:hypothetical protein
MKEIIGTYRFSFALLVGFLVLIAGFSDLKNPGLGSDLPNTRNTSVDRVNGGHIGPVEDAILHPYRVSSLRPEQIDPETLWLARAIYSETKRADEQVLVAWVIRNRVETGYRGKSSYTEVVLDPYQFSAFRSGTAQRSFYSGLNEHSDLPGWNTALRIAYEVRRVHEDYRPFSELTRHFYSERSLMSQSTPAWANGQIPVALDGHKIDENRFKFFEGIS